MKSPLSLAVLSLLVASSASAAPDCSRQVKCLMTYEPVCGSDGQTYTNQCAFDNAVCLAAKQTPPPKAALTKLFDGACDSPTNPFCGLRCSPATTMPVCGSDGNTYANPCMLSASRCANVTLTAAHEGECKRPPATPKPATGGKKPTAKPQPAPATSKPKSTPKSTPKKTPTPTAKACNDVCPMIFNPVCGSDGQTYSNPCQLGVAACKDKSLGLTTAYSGECATSASATTTTSSNTRPDAPTGGAAQCAKGCTKIARPVCGTDGVTYGNQCLLENAACANKTLKKAHDSECAAYEAPPATAPAACAAMSCAQFTECRVDETSGRAYCADVCDPKRCAAGEVCSLKQVQCFTTPCPPIATCVKRSAQ